MYVSSMKENMNINITDKGDTMRTRLAQGKVPSLRILLPGMTVAVRPHNTQQDFWYGIYYTQHTHHIMHPSHISQTNSLEQEHLSIIVVYKRPDYHDSPSSVLELNTQCTQLVFPHCSTHMPATVTQLDCNIYQYSVRGIPFHKLPRTLRSLTHSHTHLADRTPPHPFD